MSEGGGGGGEEAATKAVVKRYEGLVTVRSKAVKGKGAWYWAHLEPLLVHNHENGQPKAVKLKCCLCHTLFSASNPSRTASEHLKRGTCPHFTSSPLSPPPPQPPHTVVNHRKRSSSSSSTVGSGGGGGGVRPHSNHNNNENNNNDDAGATSYDVAPISVVDPNKFTAGALIVHPSQSPTRSLDYKQLASPVGMEGKRFEESVKKLKGPNAGHVEGAFERLREWVYESCGGVSFTSLDHPKFRAFLSHVGLTGEGGCNLRDVVGSRLDVRFEEVKNECDLRIRDVAFFQVASHGWKGRGGLVSVTLNLPNGTCVYRKAVFVSGEVSGKFAEDVLWEVIVDICGHSVHRCVGVVADRFMGSALKAMESRYGWMINLLCQCRAFGCLIKDFYRELPLFNNVAHSCRKLVDFVNNKALRDCFHKYQLRDCGRVGGLLRGNVVELETSSFEPVWVVIEDIVSSGRVLQSVLLDESYKVACMEDPNLREFGEMIRDVGFWNDLEAVRSLVRLVKDMAHEFETERPLVGQCLPLWEELRTKVKDWRDKFHIAEVSVDKVIERRFRKNYHPAWAAAYILDPFYMVRDTSGKYLPPFKYLSSEQQKDVHDLVTKLVSREEVPIALSELMRWRSDGLDPVYAQAVQLKQKDPTTGKMRIANPQGSRLVWETYLPEFQSLGKVALRLIFLHATARGFNCNTSFLKWVQSHGRSRLVLDKAQKMIFIAAQSKLERRDFTSEEDKDAELFASVNGEDDVLNEVYVDP